MRLSSQPLATGHIVSTNSYSCSRKADSIHSIARGWSKKMCGTSQSNGGRRGNHNAAFPSELVRRCIEVGSPVDGHVLDPFVGSGTTIFTALDHKRNVVGIDMSKDYTDHIQMMLEANGHRGLSWSDMQSRLDRPIRDLGRLAWEQSEFTKARSIK